MRKRIVAISQWLVFLKYPISLLLITLPVSLISDKSLPSDVDDLIGWTIVLVIAIFLFHKKNIPFDYVLPYRVGLTGKTIGYTILLGFAFRPIGTFVNYLIELVAYSSSEALFEALGTFDQSFGWMLFTIGLMPAFTEELVSRGLVYGSVRQSGNAKLAILISALFFGLVHMNLTQSVYAFALGIVFAYEREKTGSMWTSMIHHGINNTVTVLLAVLAESRPSVEKIMIDYKSRPVLSYIMLIVGTVISIFCLRGLKPSEKARQLQEEMEAVILQEKSEDSSKFHAVSWMLGLLLLIYFAATIFFTVYLKDHTTFSWMKN